MLSKQEEQLERRETLDNDRLVREQQGSTFLAHTHNDTGGRFSSVSNPVVVGATSPTPKYEGAPNWAPDPTGIEPPTNVDINEMEPCGQPFEIARSRTDLGPSFPSDQAAPEPSMVAQATSSAVPLAEHGDPTAVLLAQSGRRFSSTFRRF